MRLPSTLRTRTRQSHSAASPVTTFRKHAAFHLQSNYDTIAQTFRIAHQSDRLTASRGGRETNRAYFFSNSLYTHWRRRQWSREPLAMQRGDWQRQVRASVLGKSIRALPVHALKGTNPVTGRDGSVRIRATAVCQHSRAKCFSDAYVRRLQPTRLLGLRL